MADNPNFLADMAAGNVRLALCWRVEVPGRDPLLGTDHDRDLTIATTDTYLAAIRSGIDLTGTYSSYAGIRGSNFAQAADMSVPNMDVEGLLIDPATELVPGITVADMDSGLLNHAPVTIFFLNWDDPDRWQKVLAYGNFGEFKRDSDGKYKTEVRGLLDRLSQVVGDVYSERCIVKRFGDSRCKFDVASVTRTGVVASVTDRKHFTVTLTPSTDPPTADYFSGGALKFTSGDNQDFERETYSVSVSAGVATVVMWEELPADAAVSDTLTLEPRCNRTETDCKLHDNFINMQAYGLKMKGLKELLRGGKGWKPDDLSDTIGGQVFGGLG